MPYVKSLSVNTKTNNSSGCSMSINYLEKENKGKSITEREPFFNDSTNYANPKQVELAIDQHKKGLKKTDSKYYEVVVSFSKEELKGKSDKELKEYIKEEFPKSYLGAVNNREIDKKQLTWFAKLEKERKFDGRDKEVLEGKAKSGQLKEGDQRHFHILIARKTKDEQHKISPLSNHKNTQKGAVKGGFERVKFAQNIETSFDKHFKHNRQTEQSFNYLNNLKNGTEGEKKDIIVKNNKEEQQEIQQEQSKNRGFTL